MKLCHAAAFALVGWYLMLPPPHTEYAQSGQILDVRADDEAPLSEWAIARSYDTAAQCMAEKDARIAELKPRVKPDILPKQNSVQELFGQRLLDQQNAMARCIATDDPRLKGN